MELASKKRQSRMKKVSPDIGEGQKAIGPYVKALMQVCFMLEGFGVEWMEKLYLKREERTSFDKNNKQSWWT